MHSLVSLTKLAVESYIGEGKIIEPPKDLPKEFLQRKAGVFVSINTKYKILNTKYSLRGCIGTYLPTQENIAKEIIYNAVAAATEDFRFGPIQKEELPYLSYTVYVLSEPEAAKDIEELDPKNYGIIVRTKVKCGLLLPDLDGVNTVEKQIAICCQKGGIDPEKETISIYRFTAEKYGESSPR